MALGGTVRHDLAGLEERLRLHPKELLAADVRTKNRVASSSRTHAVRLLRPELAGIKAAASRRQLKIARATPARPVATLEFSAKRWRVFGNVALRLLATKWGTGARLGRLPFRLELADGSPVTAEQMRRLFVQRTRGGRPNVLVREGKKSAPIYVVVLPSPSHAFRERGVGTRTVAFGRWRYRTVFAQEMKYRIARRHGLVLPGRT